MTRPKRRTKTYTPQEQAAALAVLAANSGNARAASRQLAAGGLKVAPTTLRGWASRPLPLEPEAAEMVEQAKRSLDEILESVVGKIARGLDRPEAIQRIMSRPVQAATVLGILVDKRRLLRGEATDIIATTGWGQLLAEIRDMRRAAAASDPSALPTDEPMPAERARPN